ncbi:hypothetical protein [Phenylobacterium sp.]|uniref:hypothetical protein n=1 Tax=Phenylobacterium sp. TaxID=1871053 RepID=UPI002812530F|nr:hypothetical protein [Phenylobacterium sp.]
MLAAQSPEARRPESVCEAARETFLTAIQTFDPDRPILLLGHNDADGLCSVAVLARAFERSGRAVRLRIAGRGENAWSEAMRAELRGQELGGIIACDLGQAEGDIAPGVPQLVIDHHVPRGAAAWAVSGHGLQPEPSTSLLAFWCAGALAEVDDLVWLAALGLIGDMAEHASFPELAAARSRHGVTRLRTATSLINAPRRTARGDASPALTLLLTAKGPEEITDGRRPEARALLDAKAEVAAALQAGRRSAPKIRGEVALIRADSPCQIHPLLAQQWRNRLRGQIVMAANAGFRPGFVHFAVRSAAPRDLIAFLAEHAPPGADENYGSGHRAATGGALRLLDWNALIRRLGFDETDEVHA